MFNNHIRAHTREKERGKIYAPRPSARTLAHAVQNDTYILTHTRIRRHTNRGHSHSYSFYSRMQRNAIAHTVFFFLLFAFWFLLSMDWENLLFSFVGQKTLRYIPKSNNFTSDAARSPSARNARSIFLERSIASLSLDALTAQPILVSFCLIHFIVTRFFLSLFSLFFFQTKIEYFSFRSSFHTVVFECN